MALILIGYRPKGYESRSFSRNVHDPRLIHIHRRQYIGPRAMTGRRIRARQVRSVSTILPD